MRLFLFTAFASLTLAAPAGAADLFGSAPPPIFPAAQPPTTIEVGTNWYVRGDVGASFGQSPKTWLALPSLPVSWGAVTSRGRTRSFGVVCPYSLQGVTNPLTGAAAGYLYDPTNTCAGTTNLSWHDNAFLANGYVDLGTYSGFTPYVGGGVGLNVSRLQGTANFVETANALTYAANLTSPGLFPSVWVNSAGQPISPQPGVLFTSQNWNRSISSNTYRFAWSLSAGLAYQLNPSATLDIGYRYINGGQSTLLVNPQTGLTVKQNNISQQVLVGVRYLLQ